MAFQSESCPMAGRPIQAPYWPFQERFPGNSWQQNPGMAQIIEGGTRYTSQKASIDTKRRPTRWPNRPPGASSLSCSRKGPEKEGKIPS